MSRPAVVITGCGRSGTLYMSKYFQAMGLDVRHEAHGEDGISSWYLSSPGRGQITKNYYGGRMRRIEVIHLVRDPLAVMASMRRCEAIRTRSALDVFRRLYPDIEEMPVLDLVALWWVEWNKNTRLLWDVSYTLQVERATKLEVIVDLCEMFRVPLDEEIHGKLLRIPQDTHSIEEKYMEEIQANDPEALNPITIDDIPKDLLLRVLGMSKKLGYDLNGNRPYHLQRGDLRPSSFPDEDISGERRISSGFSF